MTFPNDHGDQVTGNVRVTSDHGTVVRQSGAVHRGHTRTQAMLPSLLTAGLGAAAVAEGRRAHAMRQVKWDAQNKRYQVQLLHGPSYLPVRSAPQHHARRNLRELGKGAL